MIVDHLNTYVAGGAAEAARRLHHALLVAGVDSRFWYKPRRGRHANGTRAAEPLVWPAPASRLHRCGRQALTSARKLFQFFQLQRSLAGRPAGLETFTSPQTACPTPYALSPLGGDLLHLHWVAKLIDQASFFASVPDQLPIVWTLHDMQPLTGGCHFAGGCEAYTRECRDCPQLGRPGEHDLSNRFFHVKRRALQGKNLHVVAPSRWLEQEARRSAVFAEVRSFRTIHNGLDTETFAPRDRIPVRRELRIPDGAVVLGFVAASLENRRKGAPQLLAALRQLDTRQAVVCLALGNGQLASDNGHAPEIRNVGYVGDPLQQAAFYSAMDLLVLPSLEDNLPQTGVESLACATPVVAFRAGGIPDFVRPGQTGLLARHGDAADLARQIEWLVERPDERARMGRNGRELVLREFQQDRQAQKYVELYRQLLDERTQRSEPSGRHEGILQSGQKSYAA